jgi:hypothetical protein
MAVKYQPTDGRVGLLVLGGALVLAGFLTGWLSRKQAEPSYIDPVMNALLRAPVDDEPETAEEATAVGQARAERDRGELIPWDEIQRSERVSA